MSSVKEVHLRPLFQNDLETIVRWNNDKEVECFMDGPQPQTMDECLQWYNECQTAKNHRLFALENSDGELLGEVELDHISWRRREAELRIRIGEKEQWGKGYGRAALISLLRMAFDNMDLVRVYLRVYKFNIRAIRCYERVGFHKQALLCRQNDPEWQPLLLMDIRRERFDLLHPKPYFPGNKHKIIPGEG